MSTLPSLKTDAHHAHQGLVALCRPFFDHAPALRECEVVAADEVPEPFAGLLVHHHHMTLVLERFYGRPVELQALQTRHEGDSYARHITLLPRGLPQVVEVGVMHVNLALMTPDVRAEIVQRQAPLGDILIRHNVLRRIEPRWYFRFPKEHALLAPFGALPAAGAYGRMGVIHCDHQPAIELLEIVHGMSNGE